MAAESITAANVRPGSSATIKRGTAGATITQGQVLALSSGLMVLCDADHADAAVREAKGIAVTAASANQPVYYVSRDDDFTIGATLTTGATLWSSATAGGITKTSSDNAAGIYPSTLGIMKDTTKAKINITYSGGVII